MLNEVIQQHFRAFIDKRTSLYANLLSNKIVSICWAFPLSREKFILDCHLSALEDFNHLNQFWTQCLDNEEKKSYASLRPDMPTVEKPNTHELDKFNA